MEKMDGEIKKTCVEYKDFPAHVDQEVVMKGMIHRIREMTGFAFVIIRTAREVVQCVYSPDFSDYRMDESVVEGCAVKITGKIVKDQTREDRYEMQIHNIEVLSTPAEQMQRQNNPAHEPFIVPLAIPLFAGPGSMSTAILLGGKSGSLFAEALALICAWSICTLILLSGRYAGKFLGTKVLAAMESLMGLLLTTMALEMIISGIKQAFHLT